MTVTTTPRTTRETLSAHRDRVDFVSIPARTYLAVDGCELPGSQTFQNAIATLYPIAYQLHFLLRDKGVKAPIGALEGVYWLRDEPIGPPSDEGQASSSAPRRWQLRLPVPEVAAEADVEQAIRLAAGRRTLPAFGRLHVMRAGDSTCGQLLHVGAYADEAPTIAKLRDGITEAGFEPIGPHHEIYLNDPRQTGEARARTVLRLEVRPIAMTDGQGGD